MSIPTPWKQNDRKPYWLLNLTPADGSTLSIGGLSTSNFTFIMEDISNQQSTTGTGTFSSLTAASGNNPANITYQPSTADVDDIGIFNATVVLNSVSMGDWR